MNYYPARMFGWLLLFFVALLKEGNIGISKAYAETGIPSWSLIKGKNDFSSLSVLAKHLDVPWALDFLPDDKLLFTERNGSLHLIDLQQNQAKIQTILRLNDVATVGEGGLLGLAVHPNFEKPFIYLYYTYSARNAFFNKVVRYQVVKNRLLNPTILLDNIPAASIHNGGRMRFGPDGLLYITTGDAHDPQASQDLDSLAGKILRIDENGSIPPNNPFPKSPVYSYGHRNPQGLAWDEQGQLWATEHGPAEHDEINLIKAGGNYGWPIITGDEQKKNMLSPILQSGNKTWAPSGGEIYKGILYFCGLRSKSLFAFNLKTKQLNVYLHHDLGRLRDIRLGPGLLFYLATNNRDGRGIAKKEDDRIVLIHPPH
jgi:glucose/arabinose dehydrogenase